jgi:hypothetical protein
MKRGDYRSGTGVPVPFRDRLKTEPPRFENNRNDWSDLRTFAANLDTTVVRVRIFRQFWRRASAPHERINLCSNG